MMINKWNNDNDQQLLFKCEKKTFGGGFEIKFFIQINHESDILPRYSFVLDWRFLQILCYLFFTRFIPVEKKGEYVGRKA